MNTTQYNKQHFIDKLNAIADDKWTTGTVLSKDEKSCVLGHCGVRQDKSGICLDHTDESRALIRLLTNCEAGREHENAYKVWGINDNSFANGTPKSRILAALQAAN